VEGASAAAVAAKGLQHQSAGNRRGCTEPAEPGRDCRAHPGPGGHVEAPEGQPKQEAEVAAAGLIIRLINCTCQCMSSEQV